MCYICKPKTFPKRTRSSNPSNLGYPRVSFRRSRLGLNVFLFSVVNTHDGESSGGMSDKTLTCRDCGEEFVFTAGEQAFYQERGFSEPQRCNNCRQKRKQERQSSGYDGGGYGGGGGGGYSGGGGGGGGYSSGPRQMYSAICSNCGKETEVPFLPRTDKPVYCRECFQERRASSPRYGAY
jgi:CxxC-x17-CxxC domain-containing protein